MQFPLATLVPYHLHCAPTSSFVINGYPSTDCSGTAQRINIYDNTCGSWMRDVRSFRVEHYGGSYQRAYICRNDACDSCYRYWADGGDSTFLKGRCIGGFSAMRSAGSFLT